MVSNEPISNIQWIEAKLLNPNEYNPNAVLPQEMKLLKLSIMKNGWIQPILIDKNYVIIDGFHRYLLTLNDRELNEKYQGKVPCAILDIDIVDRMLLTVRINRAKGSHIAFKMHEVVTKLVKEHNVPREKIAGEIGATSDEIELLLQESVFKKLNIENYNYSKAWIPRK